MTAALPIPPLALAAALACTAIGLLIVAAWLGRHTGVRTGALIVALVFMAPSEDLLLVARYAGGFARPVGCKVLT